MREKKSKTETIRWILIFVLLAILLAGEIWIITNGLNFQK